MNQTATKQQKSGAGARRVTMNLVVDLGVPTLDTPSTP
jgi:hypothetical protein